MTKDSKNLPFNEHGWVQLVPDHQDQEKEIRTLAFKIKPHWWSKPKVKITTTVFFNHAFIGRFVIRKESESINHKTVEHAISYHNSLCKEKVWILNLDKQNKEAVFALLHYNKEIHKDFTILTAVDCYKNLQADAGFSILKSRYPDQWSNDWD